MNIVIIEDEIQAARDLKTSIQVLRPDFSIQTILDSVEAGVEWFTMNASPNLIFSDIQLGDGLAFEIFQKMDIRCPIIFCTAYDEYALQAFQNNGIDYLLKPIREKQLEKSLARVNLLKPLEAESYKSLLHQVIREIENHNKNYKNSFLVPYREKLIPVQCEEIAFFGLRDESAQLFTLDNKQYVIPYTLDHLETILNPQLFFRANRQNLVAYKAIKEVEHFFDRKLLVKLNMPGIDPLLISKAKASDFLRWMEAR
jgi:DNA-binding LytR/AlgR family response regulator